LHDRVERVEQLLEDVDERGAQLVQALLDLYGEGLRRILERVDGVALVDDELIAHLLMVHDLHPVPVETRVREALDEVRPYLDSHGGGVELVGVEDGVARLRLHGSCDGCPSSTMTLKLAIEDAIHKAAPDVAAVEAEGVAAPAPGPTLLQLDISDSVRGPEPAEGWATAGALPELSGGGTLVKPVSGEPVLFVRLEETFYAYRAACPGCHESLETVALSGAELACGGCGRRYDVRRAGRCLDEPELYLAPIPLLADDSGIVRVALGSPAAA
jgi:Fe-S cluster biogenesis protein NfuA/nitrite reductase/ring-hydroxylating ferredoxin subunit